MRRPKRRPAWNYHHDSFARDGLPAIQQVVRENPGMSRGDPIGPFAINSYGVQDSSLIRATLSSMVVRRLFLCYLILTAAAFAQAPQFTIQDLGALPNLQACTATGLSQSGNVVGYCQGNIGPSILQNPATHGFLYSKSTLTDLNLTSQKTVLPMAVNDSGVVTGAYTNVSLIGATASVTPFVQQNGSVTLPQGRMQNVLPFALNNAGQLVGSLVQLSAASLNVFFNSGAIVYTVDGGATTVLPAPPSSGAAAFGINSSTTVAGSTVSENGTTVSPLLWQNGTLQTLPILMGYQQSAAIAVNDSGAAAGAAFDVNFHELADPLNQGHAVLFNTDGTVSDLGVLSGDHSSFSTGINNSGWVVGFSSSKSPDISLHLAAIFESPSSSDRAFLYANGKMYDLNTLVTNGTGWSLGYATAINNNGQIIGTGIVQGTSGAEQHGFLLTLVPTPGPAITGIAGVGGSVPYVANISDNGIVGIYGSNLAAATAGLNSSNVINNELPTNLGGTCVESGTTKWPLFFVSSGQVNALAAGLPASGAAPVSVVTNCGTANEVVSPVTNVPVAAVAPEFLYFIQTASGDDPVAAVDYTTGIDVGSSGLIPGATFAAVHEGDTIIAYGVGWGPTTSTDPIGTLASGAAGLTNKISVTLGGVAVDVSSPSFYAGLSPGSAGLYQMNFTVPAGVASGNQPLVLTVDGVKTPPKAYITVGN